MWYQLFHGDCGQIHWDNHQADGRFLELPKKIWSERAKLFAPTLNVLTRGVGKQIMGMNRVDGKLVGDVDFDGVSQVCDWITPVPGGVGPLTVAMLLHNTLTAFKLQHEIPL